MNVIIAFCDIFFIVITTSLVIKPIKRIINYTSTCSADYVISLIYIFNCIPVLLDLVIGIPQYRSWFSAFQESIADDTTCIVYNIYVTIVMVVLSVYARRTTYSAQYRLVSGYSSDTLVLSRWRNQYIDAIFIVAPLIYAIMKGGLNAFFFYGTLIQRGISADVVSNINQLIMVGLFFAITRYFVQRRNIFVTFCLMIYLLLAIWINGKRYIIVTVLFMFFYLYQMRNNGERNRVNLKVVLPIAIAGILFFSAYYVLNIKITSTAETLYSNLRIDFGRDDVTKFVIKKVLLDHEPILDYPGQTFLSSIFMLVPRSIWPSKPYPHYRYLTAAIYGRTIYNIPSGMTPSIFEMSLCNFSWLGFLVTILILLLLCRFADKSVKLENKLLLLVIIINILTQSLDAALSLLLILILNVILGKVRFTLGSSNKVRKYGKNL